MRVCRMGRVLPFVWGEDGMGLGLGVDEGQLLLVKYAIARNRYPLADVGKCFRQ